MHLRYYEQSSYVLGPLYTFGAMRVLTEESVHRYRCLPIIRIANWSDPTPHLPPSQTECDNPWNPVCHGAHVQLGDELVIGAGTSPCRHCRAHLGNRWLFECGCRP